MVFRVDRKAFLCLGNALKLFSHGLWSANLLVFANVTFLTRKIYSSAIKTVVKPYNRGGIGPGDLPLWRAGHPCLIAVTVTCVGSVMIARIAYKICI